MLMHDTDKDKFCINTPCQETAIMIDLIKMRSVILFVTLLCIDFSIAFLGSNVFKTGDPRLLPLFCANSSETLDEIGRDTATHESITVEGIKRSVIQLFSELSPVYEPPEPSATLSQVFQSYFGGCASPDRFLAAVFSIVTANIGLDGQPGVKEDPNLHFDAEQFLQGQRELLIRNNQINTVAGDGKFSTARVLLGKSLHSIQKFYAHSNWVENGNDNPADLVFGDIGLIANEETGTCNQSDISVNEITSGYFHYNDMPDGVQKCGHGSKLDEGNIGGINKDTSSKCFSPHFAYHKQASRLAVSATFDYMENVRKTIQNDAYMSLLDLTFGSPLAIAIDTSSSMGNEIEAVKAQVKEIIDTANAGGINPSVYILAPYESSVELTVTKDQEEVKEALDSLYPSGGTELVFQALQSILSRAPEFTDVLVFTDEPGDDILLVDTIISLAIAKSSKVNVIWTENNPIAPELLRTCQETGGLFIESSKTSVQDIVGLLSQSIQTSKATISSLDDRVFQSTTEILVDNSIDKEGFRIGIRVAGNLSEAYVHAPNDEVIVNLFDNSSLIASGLDFEVVFIGEGLLELSFVPDQEGIWFLKVTPIDEKPYKTEILADCSFNFVDSFEILDMNTTHPSLQPFQGQPIATSTPFISIRMTAVEKPKIRSVDFVTFVTPSGEVLHKYEPKFRIGFEEDFIVATEEYRMPNESFYIRLEGTDSRGNTFHRVKTSLISPATTYVEVTASSSRIEASPGETVQAVFTIYNYGSQDSNVRVEISDDLGFLESDPSIIIEVGQGASIPITTTFTVDGNAQVGDVSTIVVTATSLLDGTQNSALSRLVITSGVVDTIRPEYIIINETDCDSLSSSENTCDLYSWSFNASVFDLESGLRYAGVDYEGEANLEIDEFDIGTNESVDIGFVASCCVRKAALSIIDVAGNPNRKEFDKGALQDCSRLSVSDITASSLIAHWTCPCSDWEGVDRYEMEFVASDGEIDFTHISRTKECDNADPITKLRSCVTYNLNMTAFQAQPGTSIETYRKVQVTTLDSAPSGPVSISSLNKTSTTIGVQWFPPIEHKECVFKYRICYKLLPFGAFLDSPVALRLDETCLETEVVGSFEQANEFVITSLEPCASYRIRIAALTKNGLVGIDGVHTDSTELEAPGEPINFQVARIEMDAVYLAWDRPVVNPWCVQRYVTSFYSLIQDYHTLQKRSLGYNDYDDISEDDVTTVPGTTTTTYDSTTTEAETTTTDAETTTTESEITTYTTPIETTTLSTTETTITPTTELTTTTYDSTTTEAETTTTDAETTTTESEITTYTTPIETTTLSTTETTITPTTELTTTEDPLLNFDFVERISGLEFCTDYNFTIFSEGFNGAGSSDILSSEGTTGLTPVMDHPTQVSAHDITDTSATISWFPPEQHFNCIDEYEVLWTNQGDDSDIGSTRVEDDVNKVTIGPLKPCTSNYGITVRAWAQNIFGESSTMALTTNDNAPGPATNLQIVEIFSDGFTASWCPPFADPQCANSWDWTTSEVEATKSASRIQSIEDDCQIVEERQLKCNSQYILTVWAYSPKGLQGEKSQIGVKTKPCGQ